MPSTRRFLLTLWLVTASFANAAAQEGKTLDTHPPAPGAAASAMNGGAAPSLKGRDAREAEPRAPALPASGTGTRGFIPKWLETGGQGNLGDSLIADTGAAIGIGTTAPTARLDVVGDINTSTHYEVGGQRVFSVAGTRNTFVGVQAGGANTTGEFNSFFGNEAGRVNDTGTGNAFFGTFAGLQNTGGNYNAFFGRAAGWANTTGNYNSFFGTSAGENNAVGEWNSLFGMYAGRANRSSHNSFFGARAGHLNTDGVQNSFFGKDSGLGNLTGSNNAFFGTLAGSINNSGSNNTFIGVEAGRWNRTGQNNTLVGHRSNVLEDDLIYATAVGAGASVSTSNTVALGRTQDTVRVSGRLVVWQLGTAGNAELCRNNSNQIATCSSSLRYKRDVTPFGGGLSLVRRLRPVVFRWKTDGTPDVGLGAEDVARVAPLLVTRDPHGEIEGVKYNQLGAVLVNAVQEQQTQIAAQQEQLERQRRQIEQQQNQLRQQQRQIESLRRLVCASRPQACK